MKPVAKKTKAGAPSLADILARVPEPLRSKSQLDRILIEPVVHDGEEPRRVFAIDLDANRAYTAPVPPSVLVELDPYLGDIPIEEVNLREAHLRDDGLEALVRTRWLNGIRALNLESNDLTEKGMRALFASDIMTSLRALRVGYDAGPSVGPAFADIRGESLETLALSCCGLSGDSLLGLGKARLPAFRQLSLDAAAITVDVPARAHYSAEQWRRFAESPVASQLEQLSIHRYSMGAAMVEALGSSQWPKLKQLDFDRSKLETDGVTALGSCTGFESLERLSLFDVQSHEGIEGALAALGKAPFAENLRALTIRPAGLKGLKALFQSGQLPRIEELNLDYAVGGDEGFRFLTQLQRPLTFLRLWGNGIKAASIALLLERSWAPKLVGLGLTKNPLKSGGCAKVLSSDRLSSLTHLGLGETGAAKTILPALKRSPFLHQLEVLNLSDNRLSDEVATALVDLKPKKLRVLDLSRNRLTRAGTEALRAAFPDAWLGLGYQRA